MANDTGHIEVWARLRPVKKASGFIQIDHDEGILRFEIPHSEIHGLVNNTRTNFTFRFDGILGTDASQDEVFNKISKPVITNVLDGYNGTVFAYGQTGSGKTFTITGGAERYVDRGIIPRTISFMFSEFSKRTDYKYTAHVSYLEIYNENGKVSLLEDEDGNIHIRGLSMHLANSEEEALNYLFLGDTNRAVSETPMNLASSRSHCVFTIYVEARQEGSAIVRRSKLHIVDLAGSERVHKTNSNGQTLKEAKYINTSLHYLELVIVALHERHKRGRVDYYIPYRNSMMTSILRDSLGGNCKTVMVATMNPEKEQTEESISTCRFAQRVALVENAASINEEVDPAILIQRLKQEIKDLKQEIAFLKGEVGEGSELSESELKRLRDAIQAFLDDPSPDATLALGDYTRIRTSFGILKEIIRDARENQGSDHSNQTKESDPEIRGQINLLRRQLQQRDTEIDILVNMVKQGENSAVPATNNRPASLPTSLSESQNLNGSISYSTENSARMKHNTDSQSQAKSLPTDLAINDPSFLTDRNKAYEFFRQSYTKNQAIEENKQLLKEKYDRAKAVGQCVNEARSNINVLKSQIEQRRVERAMQGVVEGKSEEDILGDPEEIELIAAIDQQKRAYKENFEELRGLKAEIEQIQKLLEKMRTKMTHDFESWYVLMIKATKEASTSVPPGVHSRPIQAWRGGTPQDERVRSSTGMSPWGLPPAHSITGADTKFPPTNDTLPSHKESASILTMSTASTSSSIIPGLTGDSAADADIVAFYNAKRELMERRGK